MGAEQVSKAVSTKIAPKHSPAQERALWQQVGLCRPGIFHLFHLSATHKALKLSRHPIPPLGRWPGVACLLPPQ